MTRAPDLSIAQRVGIGFGLLLLMLLTLAGIVLSHNAASARAQEELATIIPLTERADALDRSVLTVAIRLRSFLLEPDTARLAEYEASTDETRAALADLQQASTTDEARGRFAALVPLIDEYIRATDRLVTEHDGAAVDGGGKIAVNSIREEVLASVRAFRQVNEDLKRAALERMTEARRTASVAMLAATLLGGALFVVFAAVTIQAVRRPAVELVKVAGALEAGDWTPALAWAPAPGAAGGTPPRDEMIRLGRAFGAAAVSLQARERRLRADGEVASATAASLDREVIARAALRAAVEYVGAEIGALYAHDAAAGLLRVVANHGGDGAADIAVGSGIPGQAAAERRTVLVRDIPGDTPFSVRLGFDAVPPRTVAALPLTFRDELMGVLVVATLRDLDADALAFLERSASQLGIGLHNVTAHATAQRLLRDLRERNERIQSQHEELQAQHEEIQAQQEEIQAQNEDLRQQGEQLRLHAAALREADDRKNEFLGVLAHELRNPLAAIASSVFTLRRSGTGADVVGRAHTVIQRQTRHLTRLIDDLLDITRVTHGKLRLATEEVDLAELVRAAVEDYRHAADARGLTLDLRVPDAPVWVTVDPTRMSQVAGNLLNNSTKFTGSGGRITVSVERDAGSGDAVLRVADTGIGLSPSVLPHLFQAFRQEPNGERRRDGGLGLGLALVKGLVELHGGSVTARSEGVGRGAEFVVRVPALARQTATRSASAAAPQAAVPIPSLRILLVEDDVDVAASLRTALELDGHVVETAARGGDALRRAAEAPPDVVLCDIGLPDIDGYDVARRFRGDDRLRRVCLVALSGYATDADRARALDAGFERHLVKPPDFDALDALFRTVAVRSAGTA